MSREHKPLHLPDLGRGQRAPLLLVVRRKPIDCQAYEPSAGEGIQPKARLCMGVPEVHDIERPRAGTASRRARHPVSGIWSGAKSGVRAPPEVSGPRRYADRVSQQTERSDP